MPLALKRSFAITWNLSELHGWGLVGVHTCLYMARNGVIPVLLTPPAANTIRPENLKVLEPLMPAHERLKAATDRIPPEKVIQFNDLDVLHALSNGFVPGPLSTRYRGVRNVGVIAFEDTRLDADVVARARSYDKVVIHSHWNRRLLEEKGIANIGLAFQGIDPTEVGPGPRTGRFGDRFVVFSGGKLEFRKAQDVVLEAFKRFHQRHADSVLVTAWHNIWPQTALSMAESPIAKVAPRIDGPRVAIKEWAVSNGVPADAFIDLGILSRPQIAPILWDCDLAVFPNRCEGCTNLVAMEAMGCGVPVVLSANTGHMDLVDPERTYMLTRQTPVPDRDGSRIGWGEPSVDELVDLMEQAYADREGARRRADKAMAFVRGERTWENFARDFVAACAE